VKTQGKIRKIALQTIGTELLAINHLKSYIDNDCALCMENFLHCKGLVVITGIGKRAIIAQKTVAALYSTGTPAIFTHAADAIHGDPCIVKHNDIIMCISNSGNTPEKKVLTPMLKSLGWPANNAET
jgi:arabinose-5-phosphate isomerase